MNKRLWRSRVLRIIASLVLVVFSLSALLTLPLRWLNPPTTAFVLRDPEAPSWYLRDDWVPYSDVSPQLLLAIIASEDQKFPQHWGIDIDSLKKALSEERGRRRGASTITQQLIKNLYLSSGRSVMRKGIEAWLTLWLELFLSKPRILELYVNVVEFGPGVYGVGRATERYVNTLPKQLDRWQASVMAAVLPYPKKMRIAEPSDYVMERAARIRREMAALGGVGYLQQLD